MFTRMVRALARENEFLKPGSSNELAGSKQPFKNAHHVTALKCPDACNLFPTNEIGAPALAIPTTVVDDCERAYPGHTIALKCMCFHLG